MMPIYVPQTPKVAVQNTNPAPASVERVATSIGDVVAAGFAVLLFATGALFLLLTLQPILSIVLVLLAFPIAIPLLAFLVIWYDVRDPGMTWRKH